MRPMYIIGAAIAVLALGGVFAWTRMAPAQTPVQQPVAAGEEMTITAAEVDVRSGPSTNFYATTRLKAGDKVRVVQTDKNNPGWLAIKPPAGSQSWIEATFVQRSGPNGQHGTVFCDEATTVPIKPASHVVNVEPSVVSLNLKRGTIVSIAGKEVFNANKAWLPIESLPNELRYIPETAVGAPRAAQGGVPAAPAPSGFVAPPGGDNSLLAQAAEARQKAEQLYLRVYQTSMDQNEKNEAFRQLNMLKQSATPAQGQPGYPFTTVQGQPKVNLGVQQASQTGSSTVNYNGGGTQPTGQAQWTRWGVLRKAAFNTNGQATFRLEDERGTPIAYAVAASGYTLDPYVGRTVTLYGGTAYRSEEPMRGNYVVVQNISTPDAR